MKSTKIITLTLSNAFVLLIFGSMLASCQKSIIKRTGHFSTFSTPNRLPASENPIENMAFFDSKQIYIYCKVSSVQIKQCFKQHYNDLLRELKQEEKLKGVVLNNDFEQIFKQVSTDVDHILKQLMTNINDKMNHFVQQQKDFCQKNAKIDFDRCLRSTLESNTMSLLNQYQTKNPDLNGHEYLFLKSQIRSELSAKLSEQSKTTNL